jgi:rhodanese-related sulfurtransferase
LYFTNSSKLTRTGNTMKLNLIALALTWAVFAQPLVHAQNSFGGGSNPQPNQAPNPSSRPQPNQMPNQGPNQGSNQGAYPTPNRSQQPAQNAPVQSGGRASDELKDHGVAATSKLHTGEMHGPTPTSIPGGKFIATPALIELLKSPSNGALVFDVLGGPDRLPNAQSAVPAHQAGSFDDNTQREFGQYLKQVTQGKQDIPMVFYCASTLCWMSYNAALRAVNMGYRNVLWYRGGLDAWKAAGQPLQSARQGQGGNDNSQVEPRR